LTEAFPSGGCNFFFYCFVLHVLKSKIGTTDSAVMRFAGRQVYLGLDSILTSDLGHVPEDEVDLRGRRYLRSRSGSPTLSRSRSRTPPPMSPRRKRGGPGEEPAVRGGWGRRRDLSPPPSESGYGGRGGPGPMKRARMAEYRSPSPGGPRGGFPPPGRRRPLSPMRRPTPPPARDDYDLGGPPSGGGATVPEGVMFLLGILPSSPSFNGPKLDPTMLMTVISNTDMHGGSGGPGSGSPVDGRGHGPPRGGGYGRRSPSPPPPPPRGRGYGGPRRGGGGGGRDRSPPDHRRAGRPY
jgi:hypothetical protein